MYSDKYRLAALAAGAALLGGCAVGPDFVRPPPPKVTGYMAGKAVPNLTPGAGEPSQHLALGRALPAAWWRLFRSPSLDRVVREAIAGNLPLEASRARLAEARQAVLGARGGYYPQVDLAASAERQKGPPLALGIRPSHDLPTFNLYSVGANVSFDWDLFGSIHRQVEYQRAVAETQAYQLAAAQLTVTGNAVIEAITIAALREQIDAVRDIIAADEKNLALVQQRFDAGKVARTDVPAAQTRLENDRALLPPLAQQRAAAEDALALLVGEPPASFSPPAFTLADFTLPADLPLSLPSTLVRRRPDIRAAEAELHASTAAVGVAAGRLYPTVTLSAGLDPAALTPGALFEGSNLAWNLLAGLTAPVFHGGTLEAQKQAAVDALRASLAIYKQTVLKSFEQVTDVLRGLGHDAGLVTARRRALEASKTTLGLQRHRYAAGKTGLLRLLDAERRYQRSRLRYARARAQRLLDTTQLFVALGGGWHARDRCGDCDKRLSLVRQSAPPAGRSSRGDAP